MRTRARRRSIVAPSRSLARVQQQRQSHATPSTAPISPASTHHGRVTATAPRARRRARRRPPRRADHRPRPISRPCASGCSRSRAACRARSRSSSGLARQSGRRDVRGRADGHAAADPQRARVGHTRARPARQPQSRQRAGLPRRRVLARRQPISTSSYTDRNGDTNVDEYTMRGAVADPGTRRRVFFAKQPYSNHNGGEVHVRARRHALHRPRRRRQRGRPAQQRPEPLDAALEDPAHRSRRRAARAAYSVPADNPFVGRKGVLPETWMWGLRNPWRFSFDRATGDLWIGDVGQNAYEEIDFAPRGEQGINWGWSAREGFHAFKGARPPGARDPIVEAPHADGYCAIVGGYVYRGRRDPGARRRVPLRRRLPARHRRPRAARRARRSRSATSGSQVPTLTTFGEDGTGELYVAGARRHASTADRRELAGSRPAIASA